MNYGRLIASLPLFGIGLWFALTGEAHFTLGGSDLSMDRATPVHARGYDAIAIGAAFIGIGIVNLALGIRSRARIRVFWLGAAVLAAAALYGLALVVNEVYLRA